MDLFGRKARRENSKIKEKIFELESEILKARELLNQEREVSADFKAMWQYQEQMYLKQIDILEKKARELESRALDAESLVQERSDRISELESSKKNVEENVCILEKILEERTTELQKVNAQLEILRTEYAELKQQYCVVLEQNKELSAAKQNLSEENAEYNKKFDEIKNTIPSLQGEIKRLREENRRITEHNKGLSKIIEEAKQERELKSLVGELVEASVNEAVVKDGKIKGYNLEHDGLRIFVQSLDPCEKLSGKVLCRLINQRFDGYIVENPNVVLEEGKTVRVTATRRDEEKGRLFTGCDNGILYLKDTKLTKEYSGAVKVILKIENPRRIGGMPVDSYLGVPLNRH